MYLCILCCNYIIIRILLLFLRAVSVRYYSLCFDWYWRPVEPYECTPKLPSIHWSSKLLGLILKRCKHCCCFLYNCICNLLPRTKQFMTKLLHCSLIFEINIRKKTGIKSQMFLWVGKCFVKNTHLFECSSFAILKIKCGRA